MEMVKASIERGVDGNVMCTRQQRLVIDPMTCDGADLAMVVIRRTETMLWFSESLCPRVAPLYQ